MAVCAAPLFICRLRVTKLDAAGNVASGDNNSWVSDNAISLAFTPDVLAGETKRLEGGCGCSIASKRTRDRLERFTLELNVGKLEPGLFALLVGTEVVLDGADAIGVEWGDQSSCDFDPEDVAIEAWGELQEGDSQSSTFPYFYVLFPRSSWSIGQYTMQNDFSPFVFNGQTEANALWGDGPYGDVDLGGNTPGTRGGVYMLPGGTTLPTADCAYDTVTPSS
jgi:hypothetical protein